MSIGSLKISFTDNLIIEMNLLEKYIWKFCQSSEFNEVQGVLNFF